MDTLMTELEGLQPRTRWSRRGFVMTSLATGFALAAGPVSAEMIVTDTSGLDVAEVKVPTADGEMPAYRAMPATGGPFATVLVVQEIFGVHEHIKDDRVRESTRAHIEKDGAMRPEDVADAIVFVVSLPPRVNISQMVIRPSVDTRPL